MNYHSSISNMVFAVVGCFGFYALCYGEPNASSVLAKPQSGIVKNVILVTELNTNMVEGIGQVLLTAVLENNSTNAISVNLASKVLDCEVGVHNSNGEAMPLTRYAKEMKKKASHLGDRVVSISPLRTHIYKVPVNLLYDMTEPDKYRVTARVRVFARWGEQTCFFDVESVPLEVTILRTPQD